MHDEQFAVADLKKKKKKKKSLQKLNFNPKNNIIFPTLKKIEIAGIKKKKGIKYEQLRF